MEGFVRFCGMALSVAIAVLAARGCADTDWQESAVKAGHAEFYATPDSHLRQFRWLPPCNEPTHPPTTPKEKP